MTHIWWYYRIVLFLSMSCLMGLLVWSFIRKPATQLYVGELALGDQSVEIKDMSVFVEPIDGAWKTIDVSVNGVVQVYKKDLQKHNPILKAGITGVEIDTQKWKRGDGKTKWNALKYEDGLYSRGGGSGMCPGFGAPCYPVSKEKIVLTRDTEFTAEFLNDPNRPDIAANGYRIKITGSLNLPLKGIE